MKKAVFVMISLFLAAARAYAYGEGDFQVWHTENQEFKVVKDLKLGLEEEFRWGDSATDFFYHHYDAGLVYSLGKYLDLGVNYRQVYEKKKGKFKIENRPHLNAILKHDLCGFKLDDRNRLEYRHFEYQKDSMRYRNKFTVKYPVRISGFEIQPYVADEIFIDFNSRSFSRNRFYSGIGFNLTENIRTEIYYLFQSSKGSKKWSDANVLGTKLKLIF